MGRKTPGLRSSACPRRSGVGAPVIGDLDGEYKHDSRRNVLEWCLPVIDANNKTGSLEFSVAGQPNDFFPINVSFVSKRNYCDIQVGGKPRTYLQKVWSLCCPLLAVRMITDDTQVEYY